MSLSPDPITSLLSAMVFSGLKHWSAYELGAFNLPQATVDFGATGKGLKPFGKVAEEIVNYGASKLMSYDKTPNKFYNIPKEEQTKAYRTYMEYQQRRWEDWRENQSKVGGQ